MISKGIFFFFFLSFISIVFPQNVTLIGVIKNPADKPVKNALITIRNLKDEILYEETTNRKGIFKFEEIEPKFYYLFIDHEIEGSKRIKLNPKKSKNKNVNFLFQLNGKEQPVECYLYNDDLPTFNDPVLKVRDIKSSSLPGKILISWKDIKQAKLYTLYENGEKIYVGEETRFEKNIFPGTKFCYKIKASGSYGLEGVISEPLCISAPTEAPRDIKTKIYKKSVSVVWGSVVGAISYNLYVNDEKVGNYRDTTAVLKDLEFDKEYYMKITAIDALNNESKPSTEIKSKTHVFVPAPILSSMSKSKKITLIWNQIDNVGEYNIYRESIKIASSNNTSFTDSVLPGKQYCYTITCIDEHGIESDKSNEHCTKIDLQPPKGIIADADVASMHLNWDEVIGADLYKIYEKINQDSVVYIGNTKSTQFTVKPLDFSKDICFVISSVDMDGDESDYSSTACNIVFDPPHFVIQKMTLIEPSGNRKLDANEEGRVQFSILNDGQSPAHNISFSIFANDSDSNIKIGSPFIIDTLNAGRIKFAEIDVEAELQVNSGENSFTLKVISKEEIILDQPYNFTIETESMIPPKLIIADFAISNDFGTNYIPKNEIVDLTIRIQNVGEGASQYALVDLIENRTFKSPDFTGDMTLPFFKSGDYMDIQIPIVTDQDNFTIDIVLIDYLNKRTSHRLDLESMRNYRSPMELMVQDLGTEEIVYYPDELGEVDVDRKIPFGRKNPEAIAVILGIEDYEDMQYPKLKYSNRDKSVVRRYFNEAFGLSDFQMLPSKSWQMEGGPTLEDLNSTFDPHQGDLRKRVITAEKYSDIEEMDIFIYYRGYGEWVGGKPLLIPRDAQADRHISKYPLEDMINSLVRLSVIENMRTITIFLDISFTNPEKSSGSLWDFPEIPDKICILSASSNGETSQIYSDKKHSFFTYTFLKALSGGADDGDSVIELGELTEYVYKNLPKFVRDVPGSLKQNPKFNGMDLKRTILDLR